MDQATIEKYIVAVVAAGVSPERLGLLLKILDVYAEKMLAEAAAAIAAQEGSAAVQAAEAARQKAQAEAEAANATYLETVKALANGV